MALDSAEAKKVMLAKKWEEDKTNPTNWWMSEKLDGVRAYFDGTTFYSRQGKKYFAPLWFTNELAALGVALDGELWCGRGYFQECVSVVRNQSGTSDWSRIRYLVFDAPKYRANYEQRVEYLKQLELPEFVKVVGIQRCKGRVALKKLLKEVEDDGGEGLMLREPRSKYEWKRSGSLLKVKTFQDEEAKVVGHKAGKGRLVGMCGGIECVLVNGKRFTVGTGFDDAGRRNPPKIGAVVTVKYQELSDGGIPRFPVFLRIRSDMSWADVKENAKTKIPFSQVKKVKSTEKQRFSLLWTEVGIPLRARPCFPTMPSKKRKLGLLDFKKTAGGASKQKTSRIVPQKKARHVSKQKTEAAMKQMFGGTTRTKRPSHPVIPKQSKPSKKPCSLFSKKPIHTKISKPPTRKPYEMSKPPARKSYEISKPPARKPHEVKQTQRSCPLFTNKVVQPGRPKNSKVQRTLEVSSDESEDDQPLSSLFKKPGATQSWSCPRCTFINHPGPSLCCTICGCSAPQVA